MLQEGVHDTFIREVIELAEVGWYDLNASQKIQKVGKKAPNGYGIHDIVGMFRSGFGIGLAIMSRKMPKGIQWDLL